MPFLLVLLGVLQALAFEGVDVHDNRLVGVLDLLEGIDESGDIVTVAHIDIFKTHRLEKVDLRLSIGLPKQLKVLVQTAVVLRYRHLVVVDDDDEVAVKLRPCHAQSLKGFAAAQRSVADHSDDILLSTCQVTSFDKSAGKADRGRCMADDKMIVLAFGRLAETGHVIVVGRIHKRLLPASQDLMRVALM